MNILVRIFFFSLLVLFSVDAVHSKECVILLHGLLRSADSMNKLERRLEREGYIVVNVDYPSRKYSIQELSELAVAQGLSECEKQKCSSIHFVTHSLGGILVRMYFSKNGNTDVGRVVMLGPPNQGSEVVDNLKNMPGFEMLNGPAGMQLGTDSSSVPRSLGAVNFELGIIAGTQSINFILSMFLSNPDDGKVSVESTKVKGMKDFIVLPTTHPFMMKNKVVIDQVVHFLKNGKFQNNELYWDRTPHH